MKSFWKLIQLLTPLNTYIRQIFLLAILQGLFYLAVPLGIQAVVTYTMAGQMSASLVLLSSLTIAAVVFIGLFQLWQMRINETIQQKLLLHIGARFSGKIATLRPDLYTDPLISAKINHFFDVLTLQKGMSKILLDFLFSFISIVFGLLILSFYSTFFLIFALSTALFFYFLMREYGSRAIQTSLNESTRKYLFVDWLQNMFSSLKNNDPAFTPQYIEDKTNAALSEYLLNKNEHFKVLDLLYRGILFFKIIFIAIILFLGVWLVQKGYLNVGQFVASEILVILVINAVEKLVFNLKTLYDILTATEKLHQVLELEENTVTEPQPLSTNLITGLRNKVFNHIYSNSIKRLVFGVIIICLVTLFLPWNQTINCTGNVSTLSPSNRPQTIPSRISGRIERWFIKEGDFVRKNDTIAFISEIKDDYFDPALIERTQAQVQSKESAIISYEQKINAIDQQIQAINSMLPLKLEQTKNKIMQANVKVLSDSADYVASLNNYKISEEQFKRYEELLAKGVISKTDFENRKAKFQELYAKKAVAENKWINSKNERINALIELSSVKQEYNEKLMKAESEKFSVMSNLYDSEIGLSKMQNQLSNYSIRNSYYYVTAPQDGYIVKSYVHGVGDIVKEGLPLIGFVPNSKDLSVELYIEPMDLPLVQKGMDIQVQFDGWPAFVFSGWPGVSFGTYKAKIVSIDKVISDNGKFRVLAKRHKEAWPPSIQVGSGVKGLVLLKKVPVVYELWRKINGFPPEFYTPANLKKETKKNETDKK
ncbi:MAG TPA: HlyD family efflux transporter periplasmic adaptor subunit [Flavobacteriales bacterium]|nr:HlyD family efflux transporter periplasmic adaptor subunit [Flavobacteriales bacterium]